MKSPEYYIMQIRGCLHGRVRAMAYLCSSEEVGNCAELGLLSALGGPRVETKTLPLIVC